MGLRHPVLIDRSPELDAFVYVFIYTYLYIHIHIHMYERFTRTNVGT